MGVVTGLRRAGRGNILRALSASVAALTMGGMIAPTVAQAQVAQRQIDVDIPAQDLNSALLVLTQRAGLQIVYDADKVADRRSAAVKGRLAPVEALSRLLTGTGLTFRITGSNRIAVEPAPQTADGSVQLGPVLVEGANGNGSALLGTSVSDPTSTEGTKSYAASYGSVGSKMATSLREVPHSVSVLTEQRIADQGLKTIHDVMNQVTGITLFEGTLVNSRYMSRGFAIISARADGGAAIEMPSGVDTDMAFYEHIEVMRGSDGLFGGQGEPGGVLNLVRKKPTAVPQFIGQVQAGSWNNYRAELDASGPLGFNGALRGRVVAAYQNRDFFQRGADLDRKLFYAVLEADLSPSTLLRIGGNYDDIDTSTIGYGLPRLNTGGDLKLPRRLFLAGIDDSEKRKQWEVFARLEQQIGQDWKVTADATFSWFDQYRTSHFFSGAVDPNTGAGFGGEYGAYDERRRNGSVDLALAGKFGLFGRTHEVILGGTWQRFQLAEDGYLSRTDDLYVSVPDINTFDPRDYPAPTDLYFAAQYPYAGRTNKGLYGSLKLDVADGLHLIGGGRLSWFKYDWKYINFDQSGNETDRSTTLSKESGIFTPYAALTYDFAGNWTAYASYAETYKSQSGSLQGPLPGTPLSPVTGSTYEVGVKGELADGRLNVSGALYRIDRNGQAVRDPLYPPTAGQLGTNCCYVAQGLVRSQGVDTEISGEILPGWQLTVGYTFNDNKNRRAGQRYETLTPRHLFKLFTSYTLPGDLAGLTVGGGMTAQSKSSVRDYAYVRDSNGVLTGDTIDAEFTQKGYSVWNAFMRYSINENLTLSGNLNNIFDKRYYSTIGYLDYGNWYGAPRNFLVTLRAKY